MRTTLTIDDDVAAAIEQRRRRDGLSLKQVVNTLLRDGLRNRPTPPAKKHRTKTYALRRRPGFDPAKLNIGWLRGVYAGRASSPRQRRRANSVAGRTSMPSSVRLARGSRQTATRAPTPGCSAARLRSPFR